MAGCRRAAPYQVRTAGTASCCVSAIFALHGRRSHDYIYIATAQELQKIDIMRPRQSRAKATCLVLSSPRDMSSPPLRST